jgi:hypothetical protein
VSLTQERLKELLDYSPETGEFVWKIQRKRIEAGTVAGCLTQQGYWQISISDVSYRAHRLAWLYVYGEWPERGLVVDHINRIPTDNRIANLRVVPHRVNRLNTGAKGYYWCNTYKKWVVQLSGSTLGRFDTEEEASNAYQRAKRELTDSLLT